MPSLAVLHFALALGLFFGVSQSPAKPDKAAREGVDLVLHPTAGQVVRYDLIQSVLTTSEMQGMSIDMKMEFANSLEVKSVKAPAEGPLRFEVTYKSCKGRIESPMGKVEYDAAKPKQEVPAMFNVMVEQQLIFHDKTITVNVDRRGTVTSVEGVAKLFEGTELLKSLEAQGQTLTDDMAIDDYQPLFCRLPESKASEGTLWTYEHSQDLLNNLIRFEPEARVAKITAVDAKLEYGAAVQDITKAKDAPDKPRKPNFILDSAKVKDASTQGVGSVRLTDGMPIELVSEFTLNVMLPNPMGGEDLDSFISIKYTLKRAK